MPCLVVGLPLYTNHAAVSLRNYETSMILHRVAQQQRDVDTDSKTNQQRDVKKNEGMSALDFRLRREERQRRLFRTSSLRLSGCYTEDKKEEEPPAPIIQQQKEPCVVKDKLGNEIYIRGEEKEDKFARELDQWLKKMKYVGSNVGLEQFKDIKVGVYQSEAKYGSPSYEPYPNLRDEKFVYSGGKDQKKQFHGKGNLELEDGSYLVGHFEHGIRHGDFKVESRKGDVCYLSGQYYHDKLKDKCRIYFADESWLEGYFKDGILHGFCRRFDKKNKLTFLGMYRNGKPFGTCWKIIKGGGCVVGVADEDGTLTGMNVAYLYPDFKTALVGKFKDGQLECAQVATVSKLSMDNFCIKVPHFTTPEGRLYRREQLNYETVTASPNLPDPYESTTVQVCKSNVPGANEGIFARKNFQSNTILAFYHGIKLPPKCGDDPTWEENAYKIFDPSDAPDGTLDIPLEYRDMNNYCSSLAHKTNHSFVPNSEFKVFNHPRFGIIPCIASKHSIVKGEEIFVRYGYELSYCPDWYLDAWEKGNYPVPDSMKSEYCATTPSWAETTNDDKQDELPESLPN